MSCERKERVNAKQIWQTTIQRLQTQVQPAVFTTWFQGTSALSFQDGIFVVRVPTTFAKAHLEGRFIDLIRSTLAEITAGPVEVQFVVAKENPGGGSPQGVPARYAKHRDASAGEETPRSSKRSYRLPKDRPPGLPALPLAGALSGGQGTLPLDGIQPKPNP